MPRRGNKLHKPGKHVQTQSNTSKVVECGLWLPGKWSFMVCEKGGWCGGIASAWW